MDKDEIKVFHVDPDWVVPQTYNKSFIVPLERMLKQAQDAVAKSEPSVESQHEDGIKIGKLYMIQDVIRAYRNE